MTLPIAIAFDAQRVSTVRQHNQAVHLHTDSTFFFPLHLNLGELTFFALVLLSVSHAAYFFLLTVFEVCDSPL